MARERIAEEYRGVRFRLVAPALRWPVGEGLAVQTLSKRPRNNKTMEFLDAEGTFIVFEDEARIDIPKLLQSGVLVIDDTNQRRGAKAERAAAETIAETVTDPPTEGR